jgi:hypothetical protein
MQLNLPTDFERGPEVGSVPKECLTVVLEALSKITDKLGTAENTLPHAIEAIDFKWGGNRFATDLTASITSVDPYDSDDVITKYVVIHEQTLRLGGSVPATGQASRLADAILDIVAKQIGFERVKTAA